MKQKIIIFGILILFLSCVKNSPQGDLSGKEVIRGRLFLFDNQTQQAINTPLPNKNVTIRYSDAKDTVNFLFSTATDANGYFSFPNLATGRKYTVSYQETINGIIYSAQDSLLAPNYTEVLTAKILANKQKGVIFSVYDYSGNVIKNADICIFTSASNIGYTNNICDGSSYQLKSDANGHANIFTLNAGNYYVLCSTTVNQIPLMIKGSFTLLNKVVSDTLKLQKRNGISFTVYDYSGNLLKNADICIFTSSTNIGYLNNICDGSSYQLKTDANGQANIFPLNNGTYYILSSTVINQLPLLAKNSITIKDNALTDTLRLQKPNGIHFLTTDNTGSSIGGVNLCVFNSQILFKRDTCDGSNFQLISSSNGQIDKYNLTKGKYYIYGSVKIAGQTWAGRDSVVVKDTISNCILKLFKK